MWSVSSSRTRVGFGFGDWTLSRLLQCAGSAGAVAQSRDLAERIDEMGIESDQLGLRMTLLHYLRARVFLLLAHVHEHQVLAAFDIVVEARQLLVFRAYARQTAF